MKYIIILSILISCSEKTQDSATQDTDSEDTGTEDTGTEDTGSEDTGSEDTGSEEPGTEDTGTDEPIDVDVPLEGFGEIEGDCGVLLGSSLSSTSFMIQNSIDFANLTLSDEDLSEGSQEMLNDGNLNSGSLYSEIFAFEMLYRCEMATLLQTETEIEYIDPNGKKTDLVVSINEKQFGISVTRAFNYPPEDPYTREAAEILLEDKLSDIELSSSNVANPMWERQILSIIAYSPDHVTQISSAWESLDPTRKADTIIYVTATNGDDDFIY